MYEGFIVLWLVTIYGLEQGDGGSSVAKWSESYGAYKENHMVYVEIKGASSEWTLASHACISNLCGVISLGGFRSWLHWEVEVVSDEDAPPVALSSDQPKTDEMEDALKHPETEQKPKEKHAPKLDNGKSVDPDK
ncbi:hypothetical protein BDQ12DRAFT_668457 [Crucibulum laeve]|uniref:Uncharacterized protein n=1 Tax=Crucibulum laeve TaxID=68775 RepID=A0A5C3LSK3_9AGAR|nr:hypothetical protein BDQ12DRAFT_668457 [Crucibulum laeve]